MDFQNIDIWLKFAQMFAAGSVGVAGIIVSIQQLRLNRSKHRFELYDKRLEQYNYLMTYLIDISGAKEFDLDIVVNFRRSTAESRFLFEKKIADLFDRAFRAGLRLDTFEEDMQDFAHTGKLDENINKLRLQELREVGKIIEDAPNHFEKYLSLKAI